MGTPALAPHQWAMTPALAPHQRILTLALALAPQCQRDLALATSAKTQPKVMEPNGMMPMASTTIANGTHHTNLTATGMEMTTRASWMVSPPAKLAAHVVVVLPQIMVTLAPAQISYSSRPRQNLRAQSWRSHFRGSLC